jgi:hypothetical protein
MIYAMLGALALTGSAQQATDLPMIPAFFRGEAIYQICQQPNRGQCSMYVAGVLDGMFYARSRGGPRLCPSAMNNREAADIVIAYLEENPEMRSRAASAVVRSALADRLACNSEEAESSTTAP